MFGFHLRLLFIADLSVFYLGGEFAVVAVFDEVVDIDAGEEDLDLEVYVGL